MVIKCESNDTWSIIMACKSHDIWNIQNIKHMIMWITWSQVMWITTQDSHILEKMDLIWLLFLNALYSFHKLFREMTALYCSVSRIHGDTGIALDSEEQWWQNTGPHHVPTVYKCVTGTLEKIKTIWRVPVMHGLY